MSLIDIKNITVKFGQKKAPLTAVKNVSLSIDKGKTLGIVGESGSGKTTLGKTVMGLIKPSEGYVEIDGLNITSMSSKELRSNRITCQMIFQDPYASLNPRYTIYETIAEPLIFHKITDRKNVLRKIKKILNEVGLPNDSINKYPHELSGGQRQRVAIARTLSVNPKIVIADEPVSALDVSIQAQILNLLTDIKKERNLTMMFISHDLSVISHISDKITVMYRGSVVENGERNLINNPKNEYTKKLSNSILKIDL